MKTRPRETRRYYHDRLQRMLVEFPETGLVENKYLAIKLMLQKKYPQVMSSTSPDSMLKFLKDVVYVDRRIREATHGRQEKIKKMLSDQYLAEQDQFI